MSLSSRRLSILLMLVPTLACGGKSPTGSGTETPRCRRYATALTTTVETSSSSASESESCGFDVTSRVLRCTATITNGNDASVARSKTYATVADFVEEARAAGRERHDSFETVYSGGFTMTLRYTFDTQRRPATSQLIYSGRVPAVPEARTS
jgi:hypothetical protein